MSQKNGAPPTANADDAAAQAAAEAITGCASRIFSSALASNGIVNEGSAGVFGQYRVELDSTAAIKRDASNLNLKTDFTITDVKPALARSQAEKTVEKFRGNRTGLLLSENWSAFYERIGAGGISCTVLPIAQVAADSGGKTSEVKFTPALPFFISPAEDAATYQAEIGSGRSFKKIIAEIVASGITEYEVGSTFEGSVEITPADAAAEGADYAVHVVTDFGGAEKTAAIGLLPDATYYFAGGNLSVIVVNTGNASTPTITYAKSAE